MLKSLAVFQVQTDPRRPEQSEIREIEVVRLDDKKRTGRPLKLTEARFRRMLTLIREGDTNTGACRIEGIHYTTWRDHIQQKPHWRAELAEAEKVRDEVWRDFALEMVKSAMPKNWQAAMTYLERKFPNEFSLKQVVRDSGNIEEAALCDKVSLEELVEMAKIAAEIAANPPPGLAQNQAALLPSEAETA